MNATIVTTKTAESAEIEFPYVFGETMDELTERFGSDVVLSYALRGLVVAVQGHARGLIKSGKSAEEIAAVMADWKPGAPRVSKSAEDKAREQLAALTPEQRATLLKELQAEKRRQG